MANSKIPCIDTQLSLPTTKREQQDLVDKAIDWALMHAMCLKSKHNFNKSMLQFVPFTLLPSAFPREEFDKACEMQTILNILVHRVAYNYTFLKETLQETIKADNFTKRLFDIYETVYKEGFTQKISLGLLRSDLMLDTTCPEKNNCGKHMSYCCLKQVEINTIASGFGWIGPVSGQLHRFILQELGYKDQLNNLPENNALQDLCGAMIDAWKLYGNLEGVILFVVEDITYNICDQRFHEFEIKKHNPDIKVIRRTLTDISTTAKLGSNKELIVEDLVVSVVYYRCGYEPKQYHTEKEWDTRLLIERSLAIKCPSIQYHLAGTKKVQQALSEPGILATFLQDESNISNIKEIFTALPDVIHAIAKYEVGSEPRELFFFREGTVVMWNISDMESGNILQFLRCYEENSYSFDLIHTESEVMTYTYSESGKKCHIKDGNIILTKDATNLEKYTFSNAIAQSVKLGIWETSLDDYINTIEFVTEDLKAGKKLKMSQREVLRKQGELFALRHLINLSSDLLDTPDFYWERDDLENLYQQVYGYFNIAKRTRVMNEKLNHCVELVAILSSHLSDRHHIRLEWMIIILIMVEVAFETIHYVDRYLAK